MCFSDRHSNIVEPIQFARPEAQFGRWIRTEQSTSPFGMTNTTTEQGRSGKKWR